MPQTLTLQLPDETIQRDQQSAIAAHKRLEDFIVERLIETTPLRNSLLPAKTETELKAMETLSDEALWAVARTRLAPKQQRLYNRLLTKNVQGNITEVEKAQLKTLGDEARLLTLKRRMFINIPLSMVIPLCAWGCGGKKLSVNKRNKSRRKGSKVYGSFSLRAKKRTYPARYRAGRKFRPA